VTRDLRAQETTKTQERIMKKVLLTTTALVMTAGFAAAEVTMSGTTQAAVSSTRSGDNVLSTHIDFNVAVSGESDNGVTMSAAFGYDAGRQVDAGDFELDAEEGSTTTVAGTSSDATNPNWSTAAPSLTIGYAGYTITADGSGVADYYNGDIDSGELGIAGSMGDVAFGVTSSIGAAAGQSKSSYSLSYTMGDITVAVVGTDNADGSVGTDATKATLTYKMGDTTFTASSDDKDGATIETVTSLGVSSKLSDAVTISYTAKNTETLNSSIGDDWDAKISYTAGALTASYGTDEDSVSTISASYDLGGGANLFAAIRSGTDAGHATQTNRDFQAVGINFTF
jgi:outer membrane protein OmpU